MPTIIVNYVGGTDSDINWLLFPFINPTTVNVGAYIVNYGYNSDSSITSRIHSIKNVKVEMGGVDVTSTTAKILQDATLGNFIDLKITVTDDVVMTVYYEDNPTATYNLTNCTYESSNIIKPMWGETIGHTSDGNVTANAEYTLHNAIVSILMDNVDITSNVWTDPPADTSQTGLYIPNVQGNVSVTITAELNVDVNISYNLISCSSTNTSTTIRKYLNYTTVIEKLISNVFIYYKVTMGGVDITSSVWQENSSGNGVINIPEVTGDIVITATAELVQYNLSYDLTNCVLSNTPDVIDLYSSFTSVVTLPTGNYAIVGVRITMGNVDITTTAWNPLTNTIYIEHVTGNISITISSTEGVIALNLYENNAEHNRVDKRFHINLVGTISGVLKDATSITTPSIIIERNTVDFNYVYVSLFNRYYYVDEVITVKYGLWQVRLKVDVLMSYRTQILGCLAMIDRNEFDFNNELIDSERVIENEPVIDIIQSSTTMFDSPMDISDTVITYKED